MAESIESDPIDMEGEMKAFRTLIALFPLLFLVPSAVDAEAPNFSYAQWSFGGLYLKSYKVYWQSVQFTFKKANGQTFTAWEKNGHRCPNKPPLILNTNNPEWKETMRVIIAAGLAGKPMHVWFWGQTQEENSDPNRRCYLQGVRIDL